MEEYGYLACLPEEAWREFLRHLRPTCRAFELDQLFRDGQSENWLRAQGHLELTEMAWYEACRAGCPLALLRLDRQYQHELQRQLLHAAHPKFSPQVLQACLGCLMQRHDVRLLNLLLSLQTVGEEWIACLPPLDSLLLAPSHGSLVTASFLFKRVRQLRPTHYVLRDRRRLEQALCQQVTQALSLPQPGRRFVWSWRALRWYQTRFTHHRLCSYWEAVWFERLGPVMWQQVANHLPRAGSHLSLTLFEQLIAHPSLCRFVPNLLRLDYQFRQGHKVTSFHALSLVDAVRHPKVRYFFALSVAHGRRTLMQQLLIYYRELFPDQNLKVDEVYLLAAARGGHFFVLSDYAEYLETLSETKGTIFPLKVLMEALLSPKDPLNLRMLWHKYFLDHRSLKSRRTQMELFRQAARSGHSSTVRMIIHELQLTLEEEHLNVLVRCHQERVIWELLDHPRYHLTLTRRLFLSAAECTNLGVLRRLVEDPTLQYLRTPELLHTLSQKLRLPVKRRYQSECLAYLEAHRDCFVAPHSTKREGEAE